VGDRGGSVMHSCGCTSGPYRPRGGEGGGGGGGDESAARQLLFKTVKRCFWRNSEPRELLEHPAATDIIFY